MTAVTESRTMPLPDDVLDRNGVAALLGVTPGTVTRYGSSDRARYRFPAPAGHLGGSPYWHRADIEAWIAARPGKGAGAGRPRRNARK